MDTMVFFQHLKHLMLRVISAPVAHAFGHSGRCSTGFNAHTQFQRMDGTALWTQGFVETPPQPHGAKKRRHRAGMSAASTIETTLKLHPRRRLIVVFRLQAIQRPGHDTSTDFAKQRAEFVLKGHYLLGRRLLLDKLQRC